MSSTIHREPEAARPAASAAGSVYLPKDLAGTLRMGIRRFGSPSWGTLHRQDLDTAQPANFTLTLNPEVRSYKPGQLPPQAEFSEAASLIQDICSMLSSKVPDDEEIMMQYTALIEEEMTALVFSSNANERAGLDNEQTRKICHQVFAGEKVDAENVDSGSSEYETNLEYLKKTQDIEQPGVEHVIRARRKIIQHAQAFHYLVDAALNRDRPFTEDLIKATHTILCEGLPLANEFTERLRARSYAGTYREEWAVASAGRDKNGNNFQTFFPEPKDIPGLMKKFISDFNEDVFGREDSGALDAFYIAADICQDLVMMHPFQDGNGRMCRLLLNAYLIKYAGVVMNIGERDVEREEYMSIAREAGEEDAEEIAREAGQIRAGEGLSHAAQVEGKAELRGCYGDQCTHTCLA